MELILFLKDLRKKGEAYYSVWLSLLLRFELKDSQKIDLHQVVGIPKSSYYRILDYGIKIFPNYINNYEILKQRNSLYINILNNINIAEKKKLKKASTDLKNQQTLNFDPIYGEIIDYLNECTGQAYKSSSKQTQSIIDARIKEGNTIDDFKKVIAIKSKKWLNTEYQDYLRPSTLFGGKFESYLNESVIIKDTKQKNSFETVNQATDLGWNQK